MAAGSSPRVRGTVPDIAATEDDLRVIPACAGNGSGGRRASSPPPGHPRVCGERYDHPVSHWMLSGSSPRVRGTVQEPVAGRSPARVIPACAGNGSARTSAVCCGSGHPRVCGERIYSGPGISGIIGSSPRVRGTVYRCEGVRCRSRVIPACAGNGRAAGSGITRTTGHPRVCGERTAERGHQDAIAGSSPRVRGTASASSAEQRRHRVIPACAGNGRAERVAVRGHSGHPRVCGERAARHIARAITVGSSPRVRGTAARVHSRLAQRRVIPACAGNGASEAPTSHTVTGHPRVCGERDIRGPAATGVSGSSPRVRGTARFTWNGLMSSRVIPACAGNGFASLRSSPARSGSSPRVRGTGFPALRNSGRHRVIPACAGNGVGVPCSILYSPGHPRVCGERSSMLLRSLRLRGSSPRVRGTEQRGYQTDNVRRVIPACAGNGRARLAKSSESTGHPRVCGERS